MKQYILKQHLNYFCCHIFFFCFCSFLSAGPVEELKKNVSDALPNFYGWCTQEKALNFVDLVLEVKPQICVEVGVFGGRSLFPVASTLKFLGHGTVIGIDPWDKEEIIPYFDPIKDLAHINWWAKVNMDHIYYSCLDMLAHYKLENHSLIIRTTSGIASNVIGEIDILHLDGNHSEAMVTRDVELYLPKVRSGGYIWLNDSLWVDMQPAIDLLFEACDFIKLVDSGNCILFKKR